MKHEHALIAVATALLLAIPCVGQTSKLRVLHDFGANNDAVPSAAPVMDKNGNLYGTTGAGNGLVYELSPQANGKWTETVLHPFAGNTDGAYPWGALLLDTSGNIYGTLHGTLSFGEGIFQLKPGTSGWTNSLIYTGPAGPGILFDKLGNLYGAIGQGAYNHNGAIGELSPGSAGWTYTALYNFCPVNGCADGLNPLAPPIWDSKGNLFGTTEEGGIGRPACADDVLGCGVLYEMTPNGNGTWTYTVLHQFASSSTDGQFPNGGLVIDAAGNLYGNTGAGGAHAAGTVFRFSFVGGQWQESILYDFPNCQEACGPNGSLVFDKSGNLYGVSQGGVHNCGLDCGVVFKLSPKGNGRWTFSVVHKFVGTDGGLPIGLIIESKGNLFGTTATGGTYNAGVAFELTP